jgi:hypothetical protein
MIARVVRVRETQEYEVEVMTAGGSREAARVARCKFLGMSTARLAANSIGVIGRTFETAEQEYDEDELAGD